MLIRSSRLPYCRKNNNIWWCNYNSHNLVWQCGKVQWWLVNIKQNSFSSLSKSSTSFWTCHCLTVVRLSSCLGKYWLILSQVCVKYSPAGPSVRQAYWQSAEIHRHTNAYKYLKKCLAGNEKGSDNHQTVSVFWWNMAPKWILNWWSIITNLHSFPQAFSTVSGVSDW